GATHLHRRTMLAVQVARIHVVAIHGRASNPKTASRSATIGNAGPGPNLRPTERSSCPTTSLIPYSARQRSTMWQQRSNSTSEYSAQCVQLLGARPLLCFASIARPVHVLPYVVFSEPSACLISGPGLLISMPSENALHPWRPR